MDKNQILETVKKIKSGEKKNFTQSVDLAINLKEIDTTKKEGEIEEFVVLPHGRSKPAKVCALIGPELKAAAEKLCDLTILVDDFGKWEDKRKCKKLAREYDFFISQVNIMPQVAKTFGKYLGTVGKMPSPKAGHVVLPKANIEPLVKSLKSTIKLSSKKAPVLHCSVGNEKMTDENITENIFAVLDKIKLRLPNGEHNIKELVLKTTMGKSEKLR